MDAFRTAVEAKDLPGMVATLADDVVFRSPVVYRPYHGRDVVGALLGAVLRVFEDFRYDRVMVSADGRDHALEFFATVTGREVHGCDFIRLGEDGRIAELTVMVRPRSGAQALQEAMQAQLAAAGVPDAPPAEA